MLGGGGVLPALEVGVLERVRRAKGEKRCCLSAVRRSDIVDDCVRTAADEGSCIVARWVAAGLLWGKFGGEKVLLRLENDFKDP